MASSPHQQLLHHHSTEVSCDSSGDSNSVRVKINPKQLSSNTHPKHCKYSISSSCSSSGDSGGLPRRVGGGGRLRRQKKLPQLFERASSRWWDPKFDSVNLEEACLERCFPQTQRRFRYALFYVGFACLLWSIYFAVHMRSKVIVMVVPALCFLVVCVGFFLFTFTKLYARHYAWTSLALTLLVFALTLAAQFQVWTPLSGRVDSPNHTLTAKAADTCLSQVGSFSMCIEVLFLLYTVMHLPLYLSLFLGVVYSVLFETFGYHFRNEDCFPSPDPGALHWELLSRALLHVCIHAIGIHLFVMSQVRSRSTFLKVGQSIMHGKDLEVEKALKERMIHSVMPRIIADDLMKQGDEESENSVKRHATSSPKNRKKKASIQKAPIAFRPFKMQQIEEVSILFADIVGFTKMSANKSAHALVGLLNDLFGRFDRLCEETKCEKISTLGDCYYCVAGCPEPRADHAYCCIEMGLGMIKAIEQFCQEKKEMVNMRVGVHTGTVLCGILGMRRFKFDVWSNDVNLANLMEQLGVAGKVHISEATAKYLDDRYEMEDGRVMERLGQSVVADQLKGLKTYLISGQRAKESHCSCAEALLSGFEVIDDSRVSSGPRGQGTASPGSVSDLAQTVKTFDNLKVAMAAVDSFYLLYREIARSCSCYVEALALVGAWYTARKSIPVICDFYSLVRLHFIPRLGSRPDLIKQYGRWAVISGATDGIGKAYAEELASHGLNIILISQEEEKLQAVAKHIADTYRVETLVLVADFSRGREIYAPIREALRDRDIGILVNDVGAFYPYPQYFSQVPEDTIWDIVNVNIAAASLMVHIVLPGMVERKKGAIVTVSSGSCCKPTPQLAAFSASKAYLDHFSRALQYEYASKGIFVQSLIPFYVTSSVTAPGSFLRRCPWLAPSPRVYAQHAVSTLGISKRTTGYWSHSIQFLFAQYMPEWLWVWGANLLNRSLRKEALSSQA